MNVIEMLRALSAHAVIPNEPNIVVSKEHVDKLLAAVDVARKAKNALMRRYYNGELEAICDELNSVFDELEPERHKE